jgi:hypothetical protein
VFICVTAFALIITFVFYLAECKWFRNNVGLKYGPADLIKYNKNGWGGGGLIKGGWIKKNMRGRGRLEMALIPSCTVGSKMQSLFYILCSNLMVDVLTKNPCT